jgi:hypothetical protein
MLGLSIETVELGNDLVQELALPTHAYEVRRRIAREWLIFLACFIAGFITLSLIAWNHHYPDWTSGRVVQEIMKGLFTERTEWTVWLFFLSPYFFLLFVRWILWSVKMLRQH